MEQFFNWPIDRIAIALALAVVALLGALAFRAVRAPVLWKLGTRNLGRRPLRATLIVFGLMLSTTVLGTAVGTGDTISYSMRSLVTGSLGTVDEVVVQNPTRTRGFAALRAMTQPGIGALASANLAFFPEAEFDALARTIGDNAVIAGSLPAITAQATVLHPASQQLPQSFALLAIPQPDPRAFGPLETGAGEPVVLDALAADEVVINDAGAALFKARNGDALTLILGAQTLNVRIGAVTRDAGIAGLQPLLIVPLRNYQRAIGHPNEINQVLVANSGGVASVARSAEAVRLLRTRLVDRDAAQQLYAILSRPDVQRGLLDIEGTLQQRDRERITALRGAAAQPALTDEFISLISEPRIRSRLALLTRALPTAADRRSAADLLERLATLSVLPVKQEALDRANEYGSVITTVFLVLGLFSIAAAILLIFLIFALLAADRGVELATMRALGMRRRQIMRMFLFEGMVYNLAGAALGTLVSVGAGYSIGRALARGLAPFGVQVVPHVDVRSLAVTTLIGVLLIFGSMYIAVRRVSRLEILVSARGETSAARPVTLVLLGAALWITAAFVWWRWRIPALFYMLRHPLVRPVTISLVVLGVACWLLPLVQLRQLRHGRSPRSSVVSLAGMALTGVWLWTLAQLPTRAADTRTDAITLVVAGCVLLLTTVWTGTQVLGPGLRWLDRALSSLARVRAIVRPAAGYLAQGRWRTALTVVMFGMVMFMMVLALTLIQVVVNAYADTEAPVAGYDLRADVRGNGTFTNIDEALASAPAVSRDAFRAIGAVATQEVQSVQLGLPRASWQPGTLAVVDDAFLTGIQAGMERRAAGYADAAAVWAALREQPGAAVVTTGMLRDGLTLPPSSSSATLEPFTIWARPNRGGQPIKLTVIGIVSGRSDLDAAIYTSRATATGLGVALPPPDTYFFAVRPGVRVQDAAAGLRVSFGGQGLEVTILGEAQQIANAVRLLLIRIVQGFMGLGLIAGIAALGLLAVQAVIERRQQLGTLRAIGFTRRQTRTLLLFESAVIAAFGIVLGFVLGLVVARSFVAILAGAFPEVRYAVPWQQIALAVAVACGGSALTITLATWEAGRVSPAEALRAV